MFGFFKHKSPIDNFKKMKQEIYKLLNRNGFNNISDKELSYFCSALYFSFSSIKDENKSKKNTDEICSYILKNYAGAEKVDLQVKFGVYKDYIFKILNKELTNSGLSPLEGLILAVGDWVGGGILNIHVPGGIGVTSMDLIQPFITILAIGKKYS